MNQITQQANTSYNPVSATNFDLPALHILRNEILVAVKNAETHLGEFNDDEDQAPLLLDSVEVMTQLASILDLLALDGGSDLTQALADSLQLLYDNGDNMDDDLIMDISEAIMTLDRYVEFVLLKETLEPSLLLPIINKLYEHLDKPTLDENAFNNRKSNSFSISDPQANYQSLDSLNLDNKKLTSAYRAGLQIVLQQESPQVTDEQQQLLNGMQAACQLISNKSQKLFWQAAETAVTDIKSILPLTNNQKRTLVFLEQQFQNYLSINDKRFADLVSFACQRNNDLGQNIRQKYSENRLGAQDHDNMRRFLFGPNREVTDTLNDLIQDQISNIKDNVDTYVRGDNLSAVPQDINSISEDLENLGSSLKMLGLDKAAEALLSEAEVIKGWDTPTPEDFDKLLTALIVAENSSIHLAKSHTPGVSSLSQQNTAISLHQLDTAYEKLIQESRSTIANAELAITAYINDAEHDKMHMNNIPEMLVQIAGSIKFLRMNDASKMISRLAKYVDTQVEAGITYDEEMLSNIADVIMAVDYQLQGLENNQPVGKQAMNIAHSSLKVLLAA